MNEKLKILFFDAKPYDREYFNQANQMYGFDIKYLNNRLNRDTAELAKGYKIVCGFVSDVIDAETIDILHRGGTELIALRSAGYNNVDLKAAFEKIHVVRVPAYSPHAVAEHAAGLMMALNRKIHKAYNRTREGNFSLDGLMGVDLYEKSAGVIGTGRIGKSLIQIFKGFGMIVKAYDAYPDEKDAVKTGYQYGSLQEVYAGSDVISLNCPLTPETYHLINEDSLTAMKKGVILINTGRGKLINTEALIQGLKQGKVGAAGLDVYEEEGDYFYEDYSNVPISDDLLARLLTFPNVLVTSHQGFFTHEAVANIAATTLANVREFLQGGYLKNEVCYRCETECKKDNQERCFTIEDKAPVRA